MNKKVVFLLLILKVISSSFILPTSKEQFMSDVFSTFSEIVDIMAADYSKIAGLYTAGGEVTGSASVGEFPSFRIGATIGTIFFTNPFRFIKNIDFFTVNWQDIRKKAKETGSIIALDFFDKNFFPIPVTYYNFDIGLPKGFTIGAKFNIGPLSNLINSTNNITKEYISSLFHWSLGINFKYTIMRDHKYFPCIATGAGIQYSHTKLDITNIPIGNLYLDESNDQIPSKLGFYSQNDNTSFYFDFSISKKISFFQPFASFRFVQTISHNLSKITVLIDLDNATEDAKDTYAEKVIISNKTDTDRYGNEIGKIIPVTDFILTAGFEFIIFIYRLGCEASFALASQSALITVGMRFQVEDYQFKIKKRKNVTNKG